MAQELIQYAGAETATGSSPGRPMPSVEKLVKAFLGKWWILVLTTAIPLGAAVYYIRKKPVLYVSQATAWVRGKLRLSDVGQYTEDNQTFFGTQIELLKSQQLQYRAMERIKAPPLNLEAKKDAMGMPILPKIRVVLAPKSSVIVIESAMENATYAREFLGALVDEFLALRKEARSTASGDALASVSSLVLKTESELKAEQEKLAKFQRENNMALLEESLRGGGGTLAQMNAQIGFLKLELNLMTATAIERKAGIGSTNAVPVQTNAALAAVSASLPNMAGPQTEFASAQNQLEVLRIRQQQLARYLKPKHPKMIRLTDEIAQAEKVIEFYRTRSEEQLKASLESNRLKLASLEEAAKALGEKVGDANRRMAEYDQIRAGIARQQVYYERLLALLQGVDLNQSMNQEDVGVLERASEAVPAKSQTLIILAGAAALGLGLGVAIIVLLVRMDDRFETVVDLRSHFPELLFGQLPELQPDGPDGKIPILKLEDPRHVFVESCRGLRSSLLFGVAGSERPRVIMVTSAAPSEGKSTISSNLATALAQGGAKVLLVDADVRRGHLHKILGMQVEPGLKDIVDGTREMSACLQTTGVDGLHFISRGKPCASGEAFLRLSFDTFLKNAREQFDFVVIDSIPVLAADDATSLAPKVDGVLFVIRRAYTSSKLAQEALDALYQRQARIIGIIFNRADSESKSYSYYRYSEYYGEASPK